jgi:hypothetical protein
MLGCVVHHLQGEHCCDSHLIPVHMYLCRAVIASLIQTTFSHSVYCNIVTLSVSKTPKRSVTSMFSE